MTRSGNPTLWLTLAMLGLLFGSAFLFVKVLVGVLTPMQVVAWRLALATLVVFVAMALRRDLPTPRRALLVGGSVLAVLDCLVPYILIAWASQSMQSGTAAVLMSTMPLFTVAFAAFSSNEERPSPAKITGLVGGFGGVIVLVGPAALDVRSGVGVPHAAVIVAAISYAAAAVYARALSQSQSVVDVTAVKLGLATVAAVALTAFIDGPVPSLSLTASQTAALLALGIVSTGLGRLFYLWIIARAGSVRASLVTYIVPISALALGWLVLGETIDTRTLAGTALVVASMIAVVSGDTVASRAKKLLSGPIGNAWQ